MLVGSCCERGVGWGCPTAARNDGDGGAGGRRAGPTINIHIASCYYHPRRQHYWCQRHHHHHLPSVPEKSRLGCSCCHHCHCCCRAVAMWKRRRGGRGKAKLSPKLLSWTIVSYIGTTYIASTTIKRNCPILNYY